MCIYIGFEIDPETGKRSLSKITKLWLLTVLTVTVFSAPIAITAGVMAARETDPERMGQGCLSGYVKDLAEKAANEDTEPIWDEFLAAMRIWREKYDRKYIKENEVVDFERVESAAKIWNAALQRFVPMIEDDLDRLEAMFETATTPEQLDAFREVVWRWRQQHEWRLNYINQNSQVHRRRTVLISRARDHQVPVTT